jgi:hypothetical protein
MRESFVEILSPEFQSSAVSLPKTRFARQDIVQCTVATLAHWCVKARNFPALASLFPTKRAQSQWHIRCALTNWRVCSEQSLERCRSA